MKFKVAVVFLIFTFCICFFTGCKSAEQASNSNTGKAEKIILTSFYPIYVSVINITRDVEGVKVINMTKPQTGCLHDYALTTEDMKKLSQADIFIVNGAGMESFLNKAAKQRKNLKIIEASKNIKLLKNQNGEDNPHVFVSITNVIKQVENISNELAKADKVNAEKYKSNAKIYINKLEKLRNEMHSKLDGIKNKDIITFHEAFPYFAEEFGLNIKAVVEREPGTAPTAKELAEIIGIVKSSNVKALFTEPQYSAEAAKTIADSTGAKIYTLNPAVTGEADSDAYDDYINIMKKNLNTLIRALS